MQIIDYDADSSDLQWIEKQPQDWRLSVDHFEKVLDYFGKNCVYKVSDLDEIIKKTSAKPLIVTVLTAIFDYFLDKQIAERKAYTICSKTTQDAYIKFRPCAAKRYLRKNRLADQKHYIKMFTLRGGLALCLKRLKAIALTQAVSNDLLKLKFIMFKAQYQREKFVSTPRESPLEVHADPNNEELEEIDFNFNRAGEAAEHEENFQFIRRADSDYLMVSS